MWCRSPTHRTLEPLTAALALASFVVLFVFLFIRSSSTHHSRDPFGASGNCIDYNYTGGTTAFGWPSPQEETPRVITVSYLLVFSVFPLSLFPALRISWQCVCARPVHLIASNHSSAHLLCIHIVTTPFSFARSLHCTHPRSLCAPISWVSHSRLSVYL
jgi:hypothetical protein